VSAGPSQLASAAPGFSSALQILMFRAGLNTNLVIAGTTLLGLAAGVIGVFALLRKRSLMTDALSHATLPGIAVAFLIASAFGALGRSLPVLLLGATLSGVLGVLAIQAILRYSRLHEDAAIGIVLSVFFGAGVVGLSFIQTNAPSGSGGIGSFIYGQAAAMQPSDVLMMGGIAVAAVVATLLFLKEFCLVCFDDGFAAVDGWPVSVIDLVMMALVVAVTVAGLQAVGLVLVVAMLIVPPVAARFWTDRLWLFVVIAGFAGALSGYLGSCVSSMLPRKPAGAVIVITAGVVFTISLLAAPARGIVAAAWRRLWLRLRIAGDHLLEAAHDAGTPALGRDLIGDVSRSRGWTWLFRLAVLRSLGWRGMLRSAAPSELTLSRRGIDRGARVARNHALWEQFLVSYADVAPSHVDWSVDQVEHALSDELVRELEAQLAARGVRTPDPEATPA